ncbi:GHKL domain-containing protein [Acetobacterium paludosum]|uniref:GHKL domain-containing protein n=1 Tax=Acetobacterium paludosum TaxID=52693 RepID=A0A923KT30_9FIRM|nr:sensor histidine kinase [Acetobacterium paludosum]MBC3888967.1 GHKL domain-containing protein [Acetobacterium paludosum]
MLSSNLNTVWGISLSIFPYFILAFIPVWDQLRYSKRIVALVGILCMLLNIVSVILIIQLFPNWNNLRLFHSVFFLLLYIVVYTATVQGTPSKLLFVALLVKSYADFIVYMAKFFEISYITYVLHRVYVQSSYSFYFNLFQCLILLITYPLIWIFFRKKIAQVMRTLNKAWSYLWIIPLVYYVISMAFAAMDVTLIAQWQFLVFNIASFLGFNLIYYVVIEMLEQSEKNVVLTENNEMIKQQLGYQSDYYKKFGECIEETRKGEHDLRHHLNTVLGLIQQKDNEKVEKYISELLGNRLSISDVLYCRNDVVNAILGYYVNTCKKEAIDLSIATQVPNDLEIDETDLCVIFGNILENALEACCKITNANKFIKISSQFLNNKLYIAVDNSYEGTLRLKNDIYLSQKRKEEAGIGMLSVMGMAKKYNGEASFKAVDKTFCVSIVLNNI